MRRAVLLVVLLVTACSKNPDGTDKRKGSSSSKVRGKVTYQGQPVEYGLVLFFKYPLKDGMIQTGEVAAVGQGTIKPDGTYEVPNVGEGAVVVCVVCDPEKHFMDLAESQRFFDLPGGGRPEPAGKKKPNPKADKLTEAQKRRLAEVHEKYGTAATSNLRYLVKEGEQTHDIVLE